MDQGRDADQLDEGEPVDAYLLQFWPGTAGPDRIVRRTSNAAAYWHRAHRGRPLPPGERNAEDELPIRELEALATLGHAAIGDPLAAAVSAVTSATVSLGPDGYLQYLADLRATFPTLASGGRGW